MLASATVTLIANSWLLANNRAYTLTQLDKGLTLILKCHHTSALTRYFWVLLIRDVSASKYYTTITSDDAIQVQFSHDNLDIGASSVKHFVSHYA